MSLSTTHKSWHFYVGTEKWHIDIIKYMFSLFFFHSFHSNTSVQKEFYTRQCMRWHASASVICEISGHISYDVDHRGNEDGHTGTRPPSLLYVVSVINVSSPSASNVCSDGVKDIATDSIMSKVTDHASVTTDFVTVVEDIVHENGEPCNDVRRLMMW